MYTFSVRITGSDVDVLPLPTKDDIASVLVSVTDWYSVGLKLGVPTSELDGIRYCGGPTEQKRKLAQLWLDVLREKGESPTWERIRTILEELKMVRAVDKINQLYSEYKG